MKSLHLNLLAAFLLAATALAEVPRIVEIRPADGTLVTDGEVVLEGRLDGARSLKIDGKDVPVAADGTFRAGPFPLSEGQRAFILTAVSAGGEETQVLHKLVRDSQPPSIRVRQPVRRVLDATPVRVEGSAIDLHLAEVFVGGEPATVSGQRFEATVDLTEGTQTIEILARDAAGHESRETLELVLDTAAPSVTIRGLDGGGLYREIVPGIEASADAELEALLDGAPYASATPITGDGPHVLTYDALNRIKRINLGVDADGTLIDSAVTYTYDERGNMLSETVMDLSSSPVSSTFYGYDDLDRVEEIRHDGQLEVSYDYTDLADSRQTLVKDAFGQETTFSYDGLGRLISTRYHDLKTESIAYDAVNQTSTVTRTDDTVVTDSYDEIGNLTNRSYLLAGNLGGHTSELFEYDGTGRLRRTVVANVETLHTYDTLSQQVQESAGSKAVVYGFDPNGSVSKIHYPSDLEVDQDWMALGGLKNYDVKKNGASVLSGQYSWLGPLPGKRQQGSFAGVWTWDDSRRLEKTRWLSLNRLLVGEDLVRDARGKVRAHIRTDRNRLGWDLQYDSKTGQLLGASRKYFAAETGSEADQRSTSLPSAFSFVTDAAYNLLSATETLACGAPETTSMPLETSGRNRPDKLVESEGERDLDWDDSGHLLSKDYRDNDGSLSRLHFTYDGRGRLIEVNRGPDRATATPVATYVYDGLDRRIRRTLHEQGKTFRTVWDGWQPIEDYEILPDQSERLVARRVYGASIDEMLSSEILLSPSDTDLTAYTPIFDAIGNLVLMIDAQGKPVERYEYGPYGNRYVWVDATAPTVEQVRLDEDKVIVELSEEVRTDVLESTLNNLLKLENLTQSANVPLSLEVPIGKGRRARHRLVLKVPPTVAEGAPEEGDQVRLTLPAVGLLDFFDNEPTSDYQTVSFAWSFTASLIVDDQADPRLEDACVRNGKLELSFSETPDMALASTALLIDGATTTWTLLPDGYALQHGGSLASGIHSLELTQDGFDLAGNSLADLGEPGKRTETFEIPMSGGHVHVYNALLPGEQASSTLGSVVGNVYGFQGLAYDEETGFLYVRHRYFDPQMGRFVQTDPHGYADAPNLYQYALGDPINNSDPMGLQTGWGITSEKGMFMEAGIDPDELSRKNAEAFLETLGNPYVQGSLQVLGGCSEAFVGGNAVLSGVGAAPGAVMLAHGTDLCGTGIATWILGETQDSLLIQHARAGLVGLGMDPYYANWAAAGLDIGVGVGATASVARALPGVARSGGSGGFGVLGRITEGAHPLTASAQARVRAEILSIATSKKFLQSAGLYGKVNRVARRKFWDLLRETEVVGSTRGGAAGLLSFGGGKPHVLRIAIKPSGRYFGFSRELMVKHELMHFSREAKALSQGMRFTGTKSLFGLERSLRPYDPRLYFLGFREEFVAWEMTLR